MRSLFGKIFLSFLLITLMASITTAMISYWAQIGPYGELKNRLQHQQYKTLVHSLSVIGPAVENILEIGGEKEVVSYLRAIEKTDDQQFFLLKEGTRTFSGRPLPEGAGDLAVAARRSDDIQYNVSEDKITVAMPLPSPKGQGMVMMGTTVRIFWPPAFAGFLKDEQRPFNRLPFHFPLGLPLLVIVCIAAGGCYLLARSLTAPIRHLRTAVQQMTKGDFSARVVLPRRRADELAELSRDFNTMVEQIESLLESQKRLLRDISHELRSPLTRMNLSLELARQRSDNAEPYLLRIEKESERLNELIDQLLTLTRLEGDVDTAPKEPVCLSELVRNIVNDATFEAVGLDRKIVMNSLDNVTVQGSMEMLGRALENVIRNGLRYTAAGTEVEIELLRCEDNAVLTIKDHGPGIPDKDLDQVFKPFFRVAESRDRDSGGTGIGLAIAKQAIVMHGGTIEAQNDEQGGLVIKICLPLS